MFEVDVDVEDTREDQPEYDPALWRERLDADAEEEIMTTRVRIRTRTISFATVGQVVSDGGYVMHQTREMPYGQTAEAIAAAEEWAARWGMRVERR